MGYWEEQLHAWWSWAYDLPQQEFIIASNWIYAQQREHAEREERFKRQLEQEAKERERKKQAELTAQEEVRKLEAFMKMTLGNAAEGFGVTLHKWNDPDIQLNALITQVSNVLRSAKRLNDHVLEATIPRELILVPQNYARKEQRWWGTTESDYHKRSVGWAPSDEYYKGSVMLEYKCGLLFLEDLKRFSLYEFTHQSIIRLGPCIVDKPPELKLSYWEDGWRDTGPKQEVVSGLRKMSLF